MKGLNIKNFAKVLNWLITSQLVLAPIHVRANEDKKLNGVEVLSSIIGAGSSVIGQMNQQNQMQQQQQMQQIQLQAIQPTTAQDDMFPMCKILPYKNNHITNICTEPIASTMDQQAVLQYKAIAEQNQNAYTNFKFKGGKLGSGNGKACFEEQKDNLQAQLDERAKAITLLIAQVENENQNVEKETKARMDAIQDLTAELDGGDGATRDSKARDLSVFLNDPSCAQVLSQDQINAGKGGLRGLRTQTEKELKNAQEIITNKETIEKDIRNQVGAVTKLLKQDGAQGLKELDKGFANIPNMPTSDYFTTKEMKETLNEGMKSKLSDYKKQFEDIESEMAPLIGPEALGKMKTGTTPTKFKKEFKLAIDNSKITALKNCAFDDSSGISKEVLKINLEQLPTQSGGTTTESFRKKLTKILEGKASKKPLDSIIAEIEKLELQYGMKQVTLKINSSYDGKNAKYNWSPSELLKRVEQGCQTIFSQDKLDEYGGRTMNEVFDNSYAALGKYEKLENEMSNVITTSILDRALNCTGITSQASPDTCGSGNMLKKNGNFCMKNASSCAVSVQSCYALADKVVKTKENQRLSVAKEHNQILRTQMAKHDLTLKNIAGQFMAQSEMLKKYFPGTSYELPEGANAFLVEIPKEAMNKEFGVPLINAEDYNKQLVAKLGTIREKIKEQTKNITDKIDKRIAELEQAYADEAAYWDGLAKSCMALNTNYKTQQSQMAADLTKKQEEDQKALGEFCYNASTFDVGPGCGEQVELLAEDGQQISNRLSINDQKKITTLKSFCRKVTTKEGAKETNISSIYSWCKVNQSNSGCTKFLSAYSKGQTDCKAALMKPVGKDEKTTVSCKQEDILDTWVSDTDTNEAFTAYIAKSPIKDENTSSIGQKPTSFAACNTINGSSQSKDVVGDFLKQFGEATQSVKN
ncbi:MAG: hypothetical protein ACOYL6_15645 [Bacteriovoracaceae bacterium]